MRMNNERNGIRLNLDVLHYYVGKNKVVEIRDFIVTDCKRALSDVSEVYINLEVVDDGFDGIYKKKKSTGRKTLIVIFKDLTKKSLEISKPYESE